MISLYGMGSPNVIKVMIMLAEAGLDYRFERVDVVNGAQFEPAFGRLNPNRKVPVLVDARDPSRPVTIFESGAILLYLAETSGVLWPEDLIARYRVMSWLMLQMSGVGPIGGQAIHFSHVSTEPSYARDRFDTEIARLTGVIEGELSLRPYLAGDDYSIADIAFYPWYRTFSRFLPALADRPAIRRWMTDIEARSAVESVNARIQDLTRQDLRAIRDADQTALDRYFGRHA